MKTLIMCLVVVGIVFGLNSNVMSGSSATQIVTYSISAINEISVTGNPAALTVSATTAGSQPNNAIDSSTTYSITSNEAIKKISGKLDTAMPAGVTLKVNLAAPAGAASAGDITLTTSDLSLVTGITKVAEATNTITYKLSATTDADTIASAVKTVTFTIADGF